MMQILYKSILTKIIMKILNKYLLKNIFILYMDALRNKSLRLGATDFGKSKVKNKKYYVIYNNKKINFGAKGMSDYTIHKDIKRRVLYRKRHSKVKLKDGRFAYKVKESPSYWSWWILWD